MRARRGFTVMEALAALVVMSSVLCVTIAPFRNMGFDAKVRDIAFLERLKGALLEQRIRSVKEPGILYAVVLDGSGSARFNRQGKLYLKLDDPDYRVYLKVGGWAEIMTFRDFSSRTTSGTDGFTVLIHKNGKPLGKLVYQVVTSTFREEYYGS